MPKTHTFYENMEKYKNLGKKENFF